MGLYFKTAGDGSFSLYYEERPLLEHCYPGINGESVRSIRTRVNLDGTEIIMETVYGELRLVLHTADNEAVITAGIEGSGGGILSFSPICCTRICHAEGIYQVSGETGDDTGFYSLKNAAQKGGLISAGICSVRYVNNAMTFYFADHTRFETQFKTEVHGLEIQVTAEVKTAGAAGNTLVLPDLYLVRTGGIQEGLESAAARIADKMKIRLDKPPSYNWCSWYYCYHDFDEAQLEDYLEGFQDVHCSRNIRYFMIDAGFSPSLGDWLEVTPRWKNGMKKAFRLIQNYGYEPALWIGPYMVGNRSRLYREHPDWVLYTNDNSPVRMLVTDNEPKLWDYQDEEYYVLDTSHPQAFAYMRNVFATLRLWGVRMFKTDFMIWGMQDSDKVKRYCPGKTSVEYFREFLQMIREEIGQESYWLGCIAPFFPFLGYADGMRAGGDVGSSWNGRFGPLNMIQSVMGNSFMNHVFFENDPDVVMTRDFHIRLNDMEIESLALFQAMVGGSIYTSDPVHLLRKERQNLFEFIRPFRKMKVKQPFLEQEKKEKVLVQKSTDDKKVLLYILNPTEENLTIKYTFEELGLDPDWDMSLISVYGEAGRIEGAGLWGKIVSHGHLLVFLTDPYEAEIKRDIKNIWQYLD